MVVRRYKISRLRSLVSYRVECSKRNSVSTRVHAIFSILSLGRDEAGSENFFGGGRGGVTWFSGRSDEVSVLGNGV